MTDQRIDPRIEMLMYGDELPILPAWLWRRFARFSLRRRASAAFPEPYRPRPGLPAALGTALMGFVAAPLGLAWILGLLAMAPPIALGQEVIGTLWQVQGAVVGFAVALAVYGYQAMGRTGPIESDDLAGFLMPSTVVFGVSLVLLTGVCYAILPSPPTIPDITPTWLAALCFVLSFVWALMLLVALPEAVRLADPNVRTRLRLARLRRLAARAGRSRIVELVSAAIMRDVASRHGATWRSWLPIEDVPADRRIVSRLAGYVDDIHVPRLERFLARNDGTEFYLALDERLARDQHLAHTRRSIIRGTRPLFDTSLVLRSESSGERVARLIESLRDDARRAIAAQPGTLGEILDGYAEALAAYADLWRGYVGGLEPGHLSGPLRLDTTPFGSIVDAVRDLAEAAISIGGREALGNLGYFPGRLARIGLENGTAAYLTALNLYPFVYDFGVRNPASPGSAYARGSWIYLAEFFDLIIPSLRRRGDLVTRDLLVQADREARTWIIRLGRLMIIRGDFESFDGLMNRVNAKRDDDVDAV